MNNAQTSMHARVEPRLGPAEELAATSAQVADVDRAVQAEGGPVPGQVRGLGEVHANGATDAGKHLELDSAGVEGEWKPKPAAVSPGHYGYGRLAFDADVPGDGR